MIRRLMREAVPSAFEKCLDDQNLFKWNDDIQLNIFDAVTRLVDLLVVKLSHLKEEECDVDMEEDMLPLLKALALAFDKTSCFHEHHMRDPSPAGTEVDHSFAQPILVLLPEGDRMGTDRQTEEVYMWLATFLNDMAYKHGFDVLSEVTACPRPC